MKITAGIIPVIALLFMTIESASQPSWQWVSAGTAPGSSIGNKVLAAKSGDVYVSGSFIDTLKLAATPIGSRGRQDAFLAKYNGSGALIWVRTIGGERDDIGCGIAEDKAGNIYFTGSYTDSAIMDGQTLLSYGMADIFLLKYDTAGTLIWAKHAGGTFEDLPGRGICVDKSGNLVLSGSFGAGAQAPAFGSADFGGINLLASGNISAFLVKLDTSGQAIWARKGGWVSITTSADVAVDGFDNYYIVGNFSGRANFDHVQIKNNGTAISSIFVVKYDSAGQVLWGKGIHGAVPGPFLGNIEASAIAADNTGNVCVVGTHFNCMPHAGDFALPWYYGTDILIVRYDSSGEVYWAKTVGYDGMDYANDVAIDVQANIYVTGAFGESGIFGSDTSYGYNSVLYVAKYSPVGGEQWVALADGQGNETGTGIDADAAGQLFITGLSSSTNIAFVPNGFAFTPNRPSSTLLLAKLAAATTSLPQTTPAGFNAYPNPARNYILLRQSDNLRGTAFRLCNALGQCIHSGLLTARQQQHITLPELSDGLYYLSIYALEGIVLTEKLMVRH